MASSVNIRTYRPQQLAVRESRRAIPHLRIALGREQRRVLSVAAGIALMAGLAILKHMHDLSDEALRERWVENPHFCVPRTAAGTSAIPSG